jgi:hypothetical protein
MFVFSATALMCIKKQDIGNRQSLKTEKLTLIVMIAFVWCYKTGIFMHENMKKIKIKKQGRKTQNIYYNVEPVN